MSISCDVNNILNMEVICLQGRERFGFLCPRDRRSGSILFLSCLSFCYSGILSFCPPLWNFNIAYNFWTVCARALIFHISFHVIIPFRGYHYFLPCDLDLGVWPIFLKTLTLLITFEQWELELWYFTWVFLVIRPFSGYHYFLPCDLDLGVWPIFKKKLTSAITFKW